MKRIIKGIICAFNKKLNRGVVSSEDGYTVFETGKIPIEIGETVFGEFDHEGEAVVKLESSGDSIQVLIESANNPAELAKMMFETPHFNTDHSTTIEALCLNPIIDPMTSNK